MIKLQLNGEERSFPAPLTIAALLAQLRVEGPAVAVEVNRSIVPRSTHPRHELREGDQVEVVTFVGGG